MVERRVFAGAILALVLAACTSSPAVDHPQPSRSGPTPPPSFGGWSLSASVEPSSIGSVRISLGPVTGVPKPGWVEHAITFSNAGDRTVLLDLDNSNPFQGSPSKRLALSGLGFCGGWFGAPRVPLPPKLPRVCVLMLISPVKLGPGRSVTRGITLYEGLKRMLPLVSGEYEFPLAFPAWVVPSPGKPRYVGNIHCTLSYRVAVA